MVLAVTLCRRHALYENSSRTCGRGWGAEIWLEKEAVMSYRGLRQQDHGRALARYYAVLVTLEREVDTDGLLITQTDMLLLTVTSTVICTLGEFFKISFGKIFYSRV